MRLAWALALSILFVASLARADAPARLTERGRFMPSGTIGGWAASNRGAGLTSYADLAAWAQPSLVYFVRDYVGVGAYVGYEFSRRDISLQTHTSHGLSGGLIAVAELPLASKLGWLSILQVGYLQRFMVREGFDPSESFDAGEATFHGRVGQLVISGSLPILVHASSSVAFGFGPVLRWAPYVTASRDYPGQTHFRPLQIGANSWIGVSF